MAKKNSKKKSNPKKGTKKKKLTKKERQKLAEAEAKRKAAEEEAERIRIKKEEKERVKREAKEAIERAEREVYEHHIRLEHLGSSGKFLEELKRNKIHQDIALRVADEWKLYLECNRLPNPAHLEEMNTYLFTRKLDTKTNFIDDNLPKTQEILNLLYSLDSLIENPLNSTRKQVEYWQEVRDNLRDELQDRLDNSSFNILRQLETNMTAIDLETLNYFKECPFLTLCMWTVLKVPRALNDSRPPPFIEFPQLGVTVRLPPKFTHNFPVVRALWLKYDHFSDLSHTWKAKPLPREYSKNLNDIKKEEWEEKQRIKNYIKAEEAARLEKKKGKTKYYYKPPPEVTDAVSQKDISLSENKPVETNPSAQTVPAHSSTAEILPASDSTAEILDTTSSTAVIQPTTSSTAVIQPMTSSTTVIQPTSSVAVIQPTTSSTEGMPQTISSTREMLKTTSYMITHQDEAPLGSVVDKPLEPYKRPSEIMEERELNKMSDLSKYFEEELEPGELNLRKYTVLGGVLHLDLLEQPPQPKILPDRTVLTVFEGEQKLQHIEYYEEYNLTLPETDNPENEINAKTQEELESDKLKLVTIDISLPQSVLWFESPTAVQWNKQKRIWSDADIHDSKFDKEKQIISIKTGLMAPLGLVTFRFVNLPFKTWELQPDWNGPPDGVVFSLSAAIVTVEFIIRANEVCLNQLQNTSSTALQDIVGIFYSPYELIRKLRQGGLDLFPEYDAYLYVEGVEKKHYTAENHLYHCMALFSTTHNFLCSRWNQPGGRENMVMQVREFIDRKRLPNYQMLHVTPLRACIVDCTEVSQAFSHTGVEGMKFYPDLYMLVNEHASSLSKERIASIDLALVETVYHILFSSRVLSYS